MRLNSYDIFAYKVLMEGLKYMRKIKIISTPTRVDELQTDEFYFSNYEDYSFSEKLNRLNAQKWRKFKKGEF